MNTTAILKQLLLILGMVFILTLPSLLFVGIAQGEEGKEKESSSIPSASGRLENVGAGDGRYAEGVSVPTILGYAVNTFLSLLGIIFIILILVGGTRYMTASGNEEKTKSALATIRHAIIGLLIVVGAYAIWFFLFEKLILG